MRLKSKNESQSPALNPSSSLARIRENQRRSRATRKAYLQSLEAKYQRCVQDGVTASMEIQAAARKVEKENKALRALLRDKGVGEEEIARAVTMALGEEGGSGLNGLLARRVECCERELSRASREMEAKEGSEGLPGADPEEESAHEGVGSTARSFLSVTDDTSLRPESNGTRAADSSSWSCEDAASIITAMKYDASASQVRLELGCGMENHCRVGNAALFVVMDKYSGPV